MPPNQIVDQGSFGEVDSRTRFYNPVLSSIIDVTKKKTFLRWTNKSKESVTQIRPDAIVSVLVQRKFGMSLGYGKLEPADDSTTNKSLCVDTIKLAILPRNGIRKYDHIIIRTCISVLSYYNLNIEHL